MRAYEEIRETIQEKAKEIKKKKDEMYNELREEITKHLEGKVFKRLASYESEEYILCGKGALNGDRGDITPMVEISSVYVQDGKVEISNGRFALHVIGGGGYMESTKEELKKFIKENTIDCLKELGLNE